MDVFDVVVMHRPVSPSMPAQLAEYKDWGKTVIVDEDDDLNTVPADNQVRPTPEFLEVHDQAIADADGLIVSTKRLAAVYGPLAKRTFICSNYLPSRLANIRFFPRPTDPVRVGWAGRITVHLHDLRWLRPVAHRLLADCIFTCVGDTRSVASYALGATGYVETVDWVDGEQEFYHYMSRADIGIVPLVPCDFNEAKSNLKGMEYMMLGKPVVATRTEEYAALIEHGTDGFLVNTAQEFAEHVQLLVHDAPLRKQMGQAARKKALSLSMEKMGYVWEDALDGVTKGVHDG